MTKKKKNDWGFEAPQDEPDLQDFDWGFTDPAAPKSTKTKKGTSSKSKQGTRLQVTLEIDTSKPPDFSMMLQEVIAATGLITEHHTPEFLSRYIHSVGQLPAYILAGDEDRWRLFVYAYEHLRGTPEKDLGIDELKVEQGGRKHRVFAPGETQPEIDGVTWGGTEKDAPVREQMSQKKADKFAHDSKSAHRAAVNKDENDQQADDAYIAKWVKAEKMARAPRENWETKCAFEFEEMIKYCYNWLSDIGEVPQPYPINMMDLFWQRPQPYHVKMDERTVARRTYISGKVMKFWYKNEGLISSKNRDRSPVSYRVVLAAQKLSKLIELYAGYWDQDPIHGTDEEVRALVKKAALRYVKSYTPIDMLGAKPGPLETLDPSYVDYLRLCRKYGLKEGTLLHKADL